MVKYQNLGVLRKGRRHHKHEMAKNPSLPALIAGSGRISVTGQVEFLTVDGSVVSYKMSPEICLRFARVPTLSPAGIKAAAVQPAATPADQAKPHFDALLDLVCDLERRVQAYGATLCDLDRQVSAYVAEHSHNNVVNIAAE
jgi:hypothetical protein